MGFGPDNGWIMAEQRDNQWIMARSNFFNAFDTFNICPLEKSMAQAVRAHTGCRRIKNITGSYVFGCLMGFLEELGKFLGFILRI